MVKIKLIREYTESLLMITNTPHKQLKVNNMFNSSSIYLEIFFVLKQHGNLYNLSKKSNKLFI
jgi:hypothetical protein